MCQQTLCEFLVMAFAVFRVCCLVPVLYNVAQGNWRTMHIKDCRRKRLELNGA